MKRLLFLLTSGLLAIPSAHASLVSSLDFDQAIWTKTPFTSAATIINGSLVSGGTITAAKTSGPAGGAGIQVTLNAPISTVGFTDLELRFTHSPSGNLEWSTPVDPTLSRDGFSISSTEGVSFVTDLPNQTESELDSGLSWSIANTSGSEGDLAFDASVNDGSITDLDIIVMVNASVETLSLSNFEIHGTPITSVIPEPSTSLLLVALVSYIGATRRRRSLVADATT